MIVPEYINPAGTFMPIHGYSLHRKTIAVREQRESVEAFTQRAYHAGRQHAHRHNAQAINLEPTLSSEL